MRSVVQTRHPALDLVSREVKGRGAVSSHMGPGLKVLLHEALPAHNPSCVQSFPRLAGGQKCRLKSWRY